MTISERIEAGRRERRVLTRVSRAARRLEQAERERTWALASARAEGISIRTLATAIGLSPSRAHQLVAAADLDTLDAALGELRAAGLGFIAGDAGLDLGLTERIELAAVPGAGVELPGAATVERLGGVRARDPDLRVRGAVAGEVVLVVGAPGGG